MSVTFVTMLFMLVLYFSLFDIINHIYFMKHWNLIKIINWFPFYFMCTFVGVTLHPLQELIHFKDVLFSWVKLHLQGAAVTLWQELISPDCRGQEWDQKALRKLGNSLRIYFIRLLNLSAGPLICVVPQWQNFGNFLVSVGVWVKLMEFWIQRISDCAFSDLMLNPSLPRTEILMCSSHKVIWTLFSHL